MAEEETLAEFVAPHLCPRCEGNLAFYLRTLPRHEGDAVHRIYRCDECSHFEWIAEAPGSAANV